MGAPDSFPQEITVSARLIGWVETVLDCAVTDATFCGSPRSAASVWRLSTADGGAVYLKQHRQPRKLVQERQAYERWCSQLSDAVPRLIAADGEARALLLSDVGGRALTQIEAKARVAETAHERAGAFLRRLHDLSYVDSDPIPAELALRRRAAASAESAKSTRWSALGVQMVDRLDRALGDRRLARVPCHRDFDPRNWMVESGSPLAFHVVDFEHARADVWLQDLVRLRSLQWPGAPELEAAFWSGYGRVCSEPDRRLLDALAFVDALATLVWAERHEDEAFLVRGERALAALRGV